jgi:hypothetical protein
MKYPIGLHTLATVLLAAGIVVSVAAATADSLAYRSFRERMEQSDPANLALPTADALAEAGLFADALALLRENAASPDTVTPAAADSVRSLPVAARWRVSSGMDYYHLEDFNDTIAMTPEERRDYKRLTETPLSVWLRARATILPAPESFDELTPEVYLSERKGRLETAARFTLPGGTVQIEPSVKGEKWFKTAASADTSADTSFAPFSKHSSDMGGGSCRIRIDNRSKPDAKFLFALPLTVDGEYYREDRPGYESFVEYRFLPEIELPAGSSPLHCRISGEVQYEDYCRKQSDPLDVVRMSGRIEGSLRHAKGTANATAAWMGDRYVFSKDPGAIDRVEGGFRGRYTLIGPLDARLRLRGIYEKESYGASSEQPAGPLTGTELTVCPGIDLTLAGERLRTGPELIWEHRTAAKTGNHFLWEARNVFEPGVRATWNAGNIDASVRAAYRSENIGSEFESYIADNRSFRGGAELSVVPLSCLSADCMIDYQYRVYTDARISENVTISLNVTVKW